MPKIFLSSIGVHLLMVCFFCATLNRVQAMSSTTEEPPMTSPKDSKGPEGNLQKLFPVLQNEKLTNNMLSLIHGLRKEKVRKSQRHRIKRKGAFVVSDLEGNRMLLLRKQKNRQRLNYPSRQQSNYQQPAAYDPQNVFPSGPVLNFPVPQNMVPYQQVVQPMPYNVENPNAVVQRQPAYPPMVVPQPVNMLPQPGTHRMDESQRTGSKNSLNDEYSDNFELIPLPRIKSRSLFKKHAPIRSTAETTATANFSVTSSAIPSSTSELSKQPVQREAKDLDQTKGVVNIVSLLASALEQAFSVPRDVVLPNVKRESTPFKFIDQSTEGIATFTPEQESSTSSLFIDKMVRSFLTNYSLKQPSVLNHEEFLNNPTQTSTMEPLPLFTSSFNLKRQELFTDDIQTKSDWKNFRLGYAFSMIHDKLTPKPRSLLPDDIFPHPVPAELDTDLSQCTHGDVNVLLREIANPPSNSNAKRFNTGPAEIESYNAPVPSSNTIERILQVVEDIQMLEQESRVNEDLPCNITGSWSSLVGGMLLNINCANDGLTVDLKPKTPPSKTGFLCDAGWILKLFKPFPKNELIIVNGLNEKSKQVVSFVGECRMCSGGATVSGNWLTGRPSRSCKDQKATQQLISDVWTSETLNARRLEKLKNLKNRTKTTKCTTKKPKKAEPTCPPSNL